MANSAGTHFFWEDEVGNRYYGVISDLTSFSIARMGRVSILLGAGVSTATSNVTLSPALSGAVADYGSFASTEETNVTVAANLSALTTLRIRIHRQWDFNVTRSNANTSIDLVPGTTGTTASPEPDTGHLHSVSAADLSFTDPHTHTFSETMGAGVTAVVFWFIAKL